MKKRNRFAPSLPTDRILRKLRKHYYGIARISLESPKASTKASHPLGYAIIYSRSTTQKGTTIKAEIESLPIPPLRNALRLLSSSSTAYFSKEEITNMHHSGNFSISDTEGITLIEALTGTPEISCCYKLQARTYTF